MTADHEVGKSFRLSVLILAGGSAVAALIALGSWETGTWDVTAFGRGYIPMAPSTACLIILLSCAVLIHQIRPQTRIARGLAFFAVFVVGIGSLIVLAQSLFGFDLRIEDWFSHSGASLHGIPVGRMSPFTASIFVLTSAAFLLELPPLDRHGISRQTASLLALASFLISSVVILSYAAGAPLLYDRAIIPMALLTALSFALLNCAIMTASGPSTWPLSLFRSDSPWEAPRRTRWYASVPVATFLMLFLAIGATGYFYLRHQIANIREAAQKSLQVIADLKVGQIARWNEELRTHAELMLASPLLQSLFLDYLAGASSPVKQGELLGWMSAMHAHYGYRLALFSADGVARLTAPAGIKLPVLNGDRNLRAALRSQNVIMIDLHEDRDSEVSSRQIAHLSLWVPVGVRPRGDGPAAGAILVLVDPYQFLYPLVQSWPTPSDSAEALLIRKEDGDVVFLNELRHRKNTALTLRFPIASNPRLPAAMAAGGQEGVVEGFDYRNVPVLAALRRIPGTGWSMVAKVDQAEVYAPLQQSAWTTGIAVLSLTFASALGVGLLQRRRDQQWLMKQLAADQERRALAERILYLNKYANDIILLADGQWRILEANDRASQSYGYSSDELRGISLSDLRSPETAADSEGTGGQAEARDGVILETVHRRRDGSAFPVESSVRTVEIAGERYHQMIIRDISERRKAEDNLKRYMEELRRSNEELQQFAYIASHDLQEPLRMISSYLQLIEKRYKGKLDKDADEFIAFAVDGANKLQEMIIGLLAYSRIGTKGTPFGAVNTFEVLGRAVLNLKITIEESGALVTSDRLPVVRGDEAQLVQVFQNLISNAIKFGGGEQPRIHISAVRKNSEWLFSIKDNGIGIPAEYKDRIFNIFHRLHGREYPGVGIGLSICRRIVERHGGRIWFESGPGEGTTFYFTIPLKEVKEA